MKHNMTTQGNAALAKYISVCEGVKTLRRAPFQLTSVPQQGQGTCPTHWVSLVSKHLAQARGGGI